MFFNRAGFRTQDAPVLSPATYLWTISPTPNKAGRWSPGVRRRGGNQPEVAAPTSPYVRVSRARDAPAHRPFVVVVTGRSPVPGPGRPSRPRPGHLPHVPDPVIVCWLL